MKRDPAPADPLAAHVAAWHNRRPLARRVTPRQVLGVGVVALPFRREGAAAAPAPAPAVAEAPPVTPVELTTPLDGSEVDLVFDDSPPAALPSASSAPPAAPAPAAEPQVPTPAPAPDIVADGPAPAPLARTGGPLARLRARLRLPARRQHVAPALRGLQPAFAQDFLAPLRAADVASFALEHGSLNRPGGDDWPQRDVTATVADDVVTVYLRTAAIEVGGQRVRVLIGNGIKPAIVGARLSSPLRAGVLSAVLAGGVALALGDLPWRGGDGADTAAVAAGASAAASAAHGVTVVAAAASQPLVPSVAASATPLDGASSALAQATPASAAAAPAASAPQAPVTTVAAAPAASAASAASAAAPRAVAQSPADGGRRGVAIVPRLSEEERAAARAESARLRGERPGAAVPVAAAGPAMALPAADGRYFALVTRTTRSRAASEIVQSLMDTAAASDEFPGSPRTEVMAVGSGFRAVWWPFPSEADAQRGQAALAAYGIKAEIVGF